LSERFLGKERSTGKGKEMERYPRLCRIPFLCQHVDFAVWCSVDPPEVPATVQVIPMVVLDTGTLVKKRKPALGNSAVAWWRFLEICWTGESVEGEEKECAGGREEGESNNEGIEMDQDSSETESVGY